MDKNQINSGEELGDLLEDLKPVGTLSIFQIFRFLGMGLIFLSVVFLLQKNNDPIVTFKDLALRNGQLGNLLLALGAFLFGIYFISRIVSLFKKN